MMTLVIFLALSLLTFTSAEQGKTTRYWDCCKPSCSWSGKAPVVGPVHSCDRNDQWDWNANIKNACEDGGDAYACANTSPWVGANDISYGFAAVKLAGKGEWQTCCACYELKFTTGSVAGKKMIVQSINTGSDLGQNHFDIAMPGGGVGIYNACSKQFNNAYLGNKYGGYTNRNECYNLPEKWRDGCFWRFDWFRGADNPEVEWKEVACPQSLLDRSGCARGS